MENWDFTPESQLEQWFPELYLNPNPLVGTVINHSLIRFFPYHHCQSLTP